MLYPPITPRRSGHLEVGDGHRVYWEVSGNPDGWSVVIVHGGPGGAATARSRRWFHPDFFQIVAFDQRGCGRSTPRASVAHNTTHHLLDDLERLRMLLRVDRWIVMGHSWGAALALAFAQAHPDRVDALVLASVFTARRADLAALYTPEFADWCHLQLACGDPAAERAAAHAWCAREDAVASLAGVPPAPDDDMALARARIGTHYYRNEYFLRDGQLVAQAERLRDITGIIVHGRHDRVTPVAGARQIHAAWAGSRLHIVEDAGHSSYEPAFMRALIDACDSFLQAERSRRRVTARTPRRR